MSPSCSKTTDTRGIFDPGHGLSHWAPSLGPTSQLCSLRREPTVKLDSGTITSDLTEECWETGVLSVPPEARELEERCVAPYPKAPTCSETQEPAEVLLACL